MINNNSGSRIYVDANFKRMLKRIAADKDLSIIKFTKQLAKDTDNLNFSETFNELKNNEKKKFKFNFR